MDNFWPELEDDVLQQLPPVLRAIVKALGFARAKIFLDEFGGLPFKLPKVSDTKLGLMTDELKRLRVTLKPHLDADNRIALPKVDKLFAHVRNQAILEGKDKDSITSQARQYNLTTRQVLNIRGQQHLVERDDSRYKRNLQLTKPEIEALLRLTYEAAATEGGNIYANLVHKLDKVNTHIDSFSGAQFDLF